MEFVIFLILLPSIVVQVVVTSPISNELFKERKTIVERNKRDVVPSTGEKGRVGRRLYPGWSQRASFDSLSSLVPQTTSDSETLDKESATKEAFLDIIDDISRGIRCLNYHYKDILDGDSRHVFLPKELDSIQEIAALDRKLKYASTANRVSLLSSILSQYQPQTDSFKLLRSALDHLVRLDENLLRVQIAWLNENSVSESGRNGRLTADYLVHIERKKRLSTESYNRSLPLTSPWLQLPKKGRKNQYLDRILKEGSVQINVNTFSRDELTFADWTSVYYSCDLKKWLVSYTSLIISDSEQLPGNNLYTLKGLISVDIDITNTDFNQCDESDLNSQVTATITDAFPIHGTHKCDRTSSQVSCLSFTSSSFLDFYPKSRSNGYTTIIPLFFPFLLKGNEVRFYSRGSSHGNE